MQRVWVHFLYLLYCVEAGVFLSLAPWSLLWSNSYFAHMPEFRAILLSGFVRGGVTALGILHLVAVSRDFLSFCRSLRRA